MQDRDCDHEASASDAAAAAADDDDYEGLPPIVERLERGETTPVCIIVVGMAGSGKTTLLTQIQRALEMRQRQRQPTRTHPAVSTASSSSLSPPPPPLDDDTTHGEQDANEIEMISSNHHRNLREQDDGREKGEEGVSINDDDENDNENEEEENEEKEKEEDDEEEEDCYYCVNLDPATLHVPFECRIDIRDTVKYSDVMQQYQLGPNGAILTSLNLFATKLDQVLALLERRAYASASASDTDADASPPPPPAETTAPPKKNKSVNVLTPSTPCPPLPTPNHRSSKALPVLEYILVDTPGQMEAFTWSASGLIISQALASSFPTVLCFVVDTVRCVASPSTFLSNMLYSCSLLFRLRLPVVLCFNKIDVVSHQFCLEWLRDADAFHAALDQASSSSSSSCADHEYSGSSGGFYNSFARSLSWALDEFYQSFVHAVGVSAVTGQGLEWNSDEGSSSLSSFWSVIQDAARDFQTDYVDDLKNRRDEHRARERARARQSVARLQRDLDLSSTTTTTTITD